MVILFICDPLYYSRTDNVEFLKRHSDLLSHIGINTIDIETNSLEALSVCSILSKILNLPPNAHQLPQTWVGVFEVGISHGDFGFDHLKTPLPRIGISHRKLKQGEGDNAVCTGKLPSRSLCMHNTIFIRYIYI